MTYKENIKAILELYFTGYKEEIIDSACDRIVDQETKLIFDQSDREDLRDLFCSAVTKVFGNSMMFLDFLETGKYSTKYDCYVDYDEENYIINRETGEYINWYKFTHIGRSITISTSSTSEDISKWVKKFLIEFKESGEDK